MRTFDHFVAIDWSGARGERLSGIAIACCGHGDDPPMLIDPDRRWSRVEVLEWIARDPLPNALVGFDLSPGLPFVDRGSFFPGWDASPATAKALWRTVDEICGGDAHLAASSFVAHPDARRHFRHGRGDCGDRFEASRGRLRRTEAAQKAMDLAPNSCFNLVGAAQVGKSSLTGMRLLHRLAGAIPIWPFDPLTDDGPVIVEIYTSLAARAAKLRPGRSKMLDGAALERALGELGVAEHRPLTSYTDHATDALLTAAWLRREASNPALWYPAGLDEVRYTEGWTFGVA